MNRSRRFHPLSRLLTAPLDHGIASNVSDFGTILVVPVLDGGILRHRVMVRVIRQE